MSNKQNKGVRESSQKKDFGGSPKIQNKKAPSSSKPKSITQQSMQGKPQSTPHSDMDNDYPMASGGFEGFRFDFQGDNEGEAIKVALRVRPMSSMEQARGDDNCIKIVNDTSCQVSIK